VDDLSTFQHPIRDPLHNRPSKHAHRKNHSLSDDEKVKWVTFCFFLPRPLIFYNRVTSRLVSHEASGLLEGVFAPFCISNKCVFYYAFINARDLSSTNGATWARKNSNNKRPLLNAASGQPWWAGHLFELANSSISFSISISISISISFRRSPRRAPRRACGRPQWRPKCHWQHQPC